MNSISNELDNDLISSMNYSRTYKTHQRWILSAILLVCQDSKCNTQFKR